LYTRRIAYLFENRGREQIFSGEVELIDENPTKINVSFLLSLISVKLSGAFFFYQSEILKLKTLLLRVNEITAFDLDSPQNANRNPKQKCVLELLLKFSVF